MGKFVRTKTSQECEAFFYECKQRVLRIDDWVREEKELIGDEEYGQKVAKYIGELR